jgi:hypothetical protein
VAALLDAEVTGRVGLITKKDRRFYQAKGADAGVRNRPPAKIRDLLLTATNREASLLSIGRAAGPADNDQKASREVRAAFWKVS